MESSVSGPTGPTVNVGNLWQAEVIEDSDSEG